MVKIKEMTMNEARAILTSYEYGGSFCNALYTAVTRADKDNLQRLGEAYPKLVAAYCTYVGIPVEFLQE